ncbi:hypothetical protein [Solidesulfovibrio carbinolicus]|uniref:Uncharacterized protein n=1 Tax=Solidesulfovibrio carbinolicus TaxID=296842 RepID=A0A4V0YRA2_9BACT|nr:hypothetical protein [Solidesulfovibrio carbinolicus]QAZ69092.1 hypothetical protein C3Y92_18350 [Solidesulfovibrio carbinolicus]
MSGPWSNAAAAWTALTAAWGKMAGQAVEATVGRPVAAATAVGGAGAARADPGGGDLAVRMETRPAATAAATQAPATSAALSAALREAVAAALAEPLAARAAVESAARGAATAASAVAPVGPAGLSAAPRTCLAGTGIREVARLCSPPTTATRLRSFLVTRLGLSSAIDIEQT